MIRWHQSILKAPSRQVSRLARRWLSARALDERLTHPVQSYISSSADPYLNLSIEHYLLQKSAPESAILFLYVNRPSIIIGRNQNPWLEVNLAVLDPAKERPETEPSGLGVVDLVRRRSGGGTVFHDEGNVNWTVVCPSSKFTRDKHAEMVVRALRQCGVDRARVNERHDIVLDQGQRGVAPDAADTHATPYTNHDGAGSRPLKVSGSAYKLTRGRALHHGTCLLSTPNLNVIPHYLHSPAKPYITARGVESVSSPVSNVLLENAKFIAAVQHQFGQMYSDDKRTTPDELGRDLLANKTIAEGFAELKSPEWMYLQTPQFTVSNSVDTDASLDVELAVRHGEITQAGVRPRGKDVGGYTPLPDSALKERKLHEISSWDAALIGTALQNQERRYLASWLQRILPPTRDAKPTSIAQKSMGSS